MTTANGKILLLGRLAKGYPEQAKNLTGDSISIRVDDRSGDDITEFCDIHLKMSDRDSDQFTLILDNVPYDDNVESIAEDLDGDWQTTRFGRRLTLNLTTAQAADLRLLATAIRKVVGRGRRYLNSNWKWMAPRTAKSLLKLTRTLSVCDSA